jgi:hypothetical protein
LFCLRAGLCLLTRDVQAGRTDKNTENNRRQTNLVLVSGAAGPTITQRQEPHIMVQSLNILNFASDVLAMAAAVFTMADIALRRRASRSKR